MGAVFCTATFKTMSETDLKKAFTDYRKDKLEEFGNDSYGGHMGLVQGLRIIDKTFATSYEAADWIADHQQKYSPAIAVKIGDFKNSFYSKPAVAKLVASMVELQAELSSFNTDILKRAKAAKSTMRGCKHCESRINITKFNPVDDSHNMSKVTDCPVCGENLLVTDTDTARYVRTKAKWKELSLKLAELEKNVDTIKEPKWFVGAWCAS